MGRERSRGWEVSGLRFQAWGRRFWDLVVVQNVGEADGVQSVPQLSHKPGLSRFLTPLRGLTQLVLQCPTADAVGYFLPPLRGSRRLLGRMVVNGVVEKRSREPAD